MSEFQNSLFIALITGSFTVIGLVIGALLEFWREKLQYIREKENKQNETAEENKKSYLSPLYFYINKNHLLPFSCGTETYKDLKQEFNKFDDISNNVKSIEELMKSNMHILPMELNLSLSFYISDLEAVTICAKAISQVISGTNVNVQETKLPTGVLEGWTKLSDVWNNMTISLLASIYAFMKFNITPKASPIATTEKTKEMNEILNAISASLTIEIEKLKKKMELEKKTELSN